MKKIISLICILCLAVLTAGVDAQATSAPKKANRKPSQAAAGTTFIKVVYGEKTSIFNVVPLKVGARIDYRNTLGASSTATLNATDFEYLRSRIKSIPSTSNNKEFCPCSFVELTTPSQVLVGCLGASNKVAQQLQDMANLLSLLF